MKKTITFEVSEKPTFNNEVELKQALKFIDKVEETVKLYNKYTKALKDYMVKNELVDLVAGEFHAHLSEGTARKTLDNALLEAFIGRYDKTLDDFKTLGNPPRSLEVYRD